MNESGGTTTKHRSTKHRSLKRYAAATVVVAILSVAATACLPPPAPPNAVTAGVVTATNRDRAANGLPVLGWNIQLAGLATSWAEHLAAASGGLVHEDLTSVLYSPGYEGYHTLGENLLVGPQSMSPDAMEAAWMGSPGHRANILRSDFNSVGVGFAYSSDGRIWVAVEFGG